MAAGGGTLVLSKLGAVHKTTKGERMGLSPGFCGSCVFNGSIGELNKEYATISACKIEDDPEVQATYNPNARVCGKYQLNPAALED